MSILKSANSGKNYLWHIQITKLSQEIYTSVKQFPSNLWELVVSYEVPKIIFTDNYKIVQIQEKHKLRFYKSTANAQLVHDLLISAFENNLNTITDGFTVEDVDLNSIKITIEK